VFLVFCAASLILANGVRAYGIILADHLGLVRGADHRLFSYTIYGITIPLLFWLGLKWKESAPNDTQHDNGDRLRPRMGTVPQGQSPPVPVPIVMTGDDKRSSVQAIVFAALGSIALSAVAPVLAWLLE
jgi:hypothetical protein